MTNTGRRHLITGLASLLVAPAIARAESLMPIKGDRYFYWTYTCPMLPDPLWFGMDNRERRQDLIDGCFGPNGGIYVGHWRHFGKDRNIYSDKVVDFWKVEAPRWIPDAVLVGAT